MPSSILLRRQLLLSLAAAGAMTHWAARAQSNTARSADAASPIRLALIEGLSGPFANAGEAVYRNLLWAVERVNARGGVRLKTGARPLDIVRMDSRGASDQAINLLRQAAEQGISFVTQGNSSAVAAALIDALDKHNEREPLQRALVLNYSAVEPILTNERCSFWHFRFDAHADMRLAALTEVMKDDVALKRLYLIGQDYSFGQYVLRQGRALVAARRPDIQIVGEDLHPMGKVKDFLPYATKIKASGAQAILTGNWGNDLTLLVKAMKEVGGQVKFYTFYGNALGVPGALGEAGVGSVLAVSEWHPNDGQPASAELVQAFRRRFPDPKDDYLHLRMQMMVEMWVSAMERAGTTDVVGVARALEGARVDAKALGGLAGSSGAWMRAEDHQLQQPLVVTQMEKAGQDGVRYDVEGSGYGFKTVKKLSTEQAQWPQTCRMVRPAG